MGAQVSRVYGFVVRRPLQRYNVEHRAEKMVKKFEDPAAAPYRAPMYKSDAEVLEAVRRDNPELLQEVAMKDDPLHDRLKTVYVSSTDPAPDPRAGQDDHKPLPRDVRQHYQDFLPAQMRVEREGVSRTLPRGKVSLNQAVEFISKHAESEGSFGAEQISQDYRLNQEVVANTIKYYTIFSMLVPETRESETDKPDPLQAGPDWQVVSNSKMPLELEEERDAKMREVARIQKKRAEDEIKRKRIRSGGDES